MIRPLIAALLLSACAPAFAAQNPGELCRSIHDGAKAIMEGRQSHYPMPDMVGAITKEVEGPVSVYFVAMIFEAYNEPAKMSDIRRAERANQFANEQYMKCIKNGGVL